MGVVCKAEDTMLGRKERCTSGALRFLILAFRFV
jgi:hypothetical protein